MLGRSGKKGCPMMCGVHAGVHQHFILQHTWTIPKWLYIIIIIIIVLLLLVVVVANSQICDFEGL